jgi:hypothetical protein
MSFGTFLERWAADAKGLKTYKPSYYTVKTNDDLAECEIIHRGVAALEENHLYESNICWLRDPTSKLKCCYCIRDVFVECTYKQLDFIFGKRIRDAEYCVKNNQRMLPNGIRVPVVPPEFIEQATGKHLDRKRRKLCQRRIKKSNLEHVNTVLWFLCTSSAPTMQECYEPQLGHPPRIFTRGGMSTLPWDAGVDVLPSAQSVPTMQSAREQTCLDSVRSMDDLANLVVFNLDGVGVNIGSEIISVFNYLHPL